MNFVIRPKLNVLSTEEIESLYSGTLEVLERVGVRVLHPQAFSLPSISRKIGRYNILSQVLPHRRQAKSS